MKSLGVLTIATGNYYKYWEEMIRSAEVNYSGDLLVNFHVFTDQYMMASELKFKSPHLNVIPHQIENLGWPEATLQRYKIISNYSECFTEDFLLHLDADMLFMAPLKVLFNELDYKNQMTLVRHPGFYRPQGFKLALFYFRNPSFIVRDLKAKITLGGLGSWETEKKSKAYVPRDLRIHYYCGATWFGPRTQVLKFCKDLGSNVDADKTIGVIARWHDESHLNQWAALNEFRSLPPKFCFDPMFPQLQHLEEIIRAVDKRG